MSDKISGSGQVTLAIMGVALTLMLIAVVFRQAEQNRSAQAYEAALDSCVLRAVHEAQESAEATFDRSLGDDREATVASSLALIDRAERATELVELGLDDGLSVEQALYEACVEAGYIVEGG